MRPSAVLGTLLLALATPLSLPEVAHPATARGESFEWHVLVPGPEQVELRAEPSGRVLLRGRNPIHLPVDAWNRRQVFTRPATAPSTDQTVCATWRRQSEPSIQQGLAVRVLDGPGQRERAITLTKNTFAGYFWVFNVLTWDTRRPGDPWRPVAQFDLADVVVRDGHWVPLPWRVCLRVRGPKLAFKVWLPQEEAEPSWRDPTHTRKARLPGRFVHPGQPGWYVGHLPAGQSTEYSGLTD